MAKVLAVGSELENRMIRYFQDSAAKGESFITYMTAYNLERTNRGELFLHIKMLVSQELLDTVLGIRKDEDDSQGEVTDGGLSDPDGNTDRT